MRVTIVSPEKTLYKDEVQSVVVPGGMGTFEVLDNHAPIISNLTEGVVNVSGATPFQLHVKGGFIEVARNEVSICVEVNGNK
ncbi:F0F1 ATP synthase subunit epsilon [Alloprevotella rava]|uniref:ATP synthase n=2 Tax=Alloprevotella rava TaxID=671218 RepID=G5G9B8_9BACT|nr:F0F1 ATP synthase subunit epsilon [Alloprevotella rava]EHG24603.1 ATP synthase [Alloprevotella rava F0323]MBB3703675.1 F-type H+-transporting ATPase subunit epsilon [Alloprevotella rava]